MPRTEEELLEQEEAFALEGLKSTATHLAHDLVDVIDPSDKIRKHPFLALTLASAAGFLLTGKTLKLLGKLIRPASRLLVTAAMGTLLSRAGRKSAGGLKIDSSMLSRLGEVGKLLFAGH